MTQTINVQGSVTEKEARQQLKQQLAKYIEQQTTSRQAFHKWMNGVEIACLVLIVAAFILALYLSITWKSYEPSLIATFWFFFATSFAPLMLFSGIHTLILRAYPTGVMPGKSQKLVTGSGALWYGWGFVIGSVIVAAFWGLFAYATWTLNWALLTPLTSFLGVAMGVMIVVGMLLKTIQKLTKIR